MKCRSENYPHFKADPCICPGDEQVNPEKHQEILKLCFEEEKLYQVDDKNVPMRKRCGVGSLDNVTKENMCDCTERTSQAAGP